MRKHRKTRRKKLKSQKKMFITISIFSLFLLTIGYAAFQTTINLNVKGNIKIDERCVVGNIFNFEQKNEVQEFKVPCSGTYKLETWGAQGGNANRDSITKFGGYGGYSAGNIYLPFKQSIYIATGGQGISATTHNNVIGGYNGGGNGIFWIDKTTLNSSGGGATHIALSNKYLSLFENDKSNLLIVAGGGGGAAINNDKNTRTGAIGGSGGGFIGNNGAVPPNNDGGYGTGGTNISGGIFVLTKSTRMDDKYQGKSGLFGQGGSGADNGGTGSGGGYYGGAGASIWGGGGGGSGYIGNNNLTDKTMYCYDCEESLDLTKPEIFTVSTTGTNSYRDTVNCPNGYSENPISKCAKAGNGYARITLISKKTN